jgi:hypothetical protein
VNPSARDREPGTCFGTYKSTGDIVETTESSQTMQYAGVLRIDGCRNTMSF